MSTSLTFPTITNPSYPLGEEPENNALVSNFEDGSVLTRTKFTRNRYTYSLKWNDLPNDEYQTLKDFIINSAKYTVNSFMWTHPLTGVVKEVRISEVSKAELNGLNYWTVELKLQEV
jgi:phage-related protein